MAVLVCKKSKAISTTHFLFEKFIIINVQTAAIKKNEELVKLPLRYFAVICTSTIKLRSIGSAQLKGINQKEAKKRSNIGNMKVKIKLPNIPRGMESSETFSPINNPKIN